MSESFELIKRPATDNIFAALSTRSNMQQVHARFKLKQVNRAQAYYKQPGSADEPKLVESAHVMLSAVQGEPFGAYTPSGEAQMIIVNPAASQMFFDAAIGQEFDLLISPVTE
jgi:hypothetical protein